MQLKIVSKTQNSSFNRTEVIASASGFTSTPSRREVLEALVGELKCESGALVIEQITQPFGSKTVEVKARVYSTAEQATKTEPKYKFERGMPKAVAKPA